MADLSYQAFLATKKKSASLLYSPTALAPTFSAYKAAPVAAPVATPPKGTDLSYQAYLAQKKPTVPTLLQSSAPINFSGTYKPVNQSFIPPNQSTPTGPVYKAPPVVSPKTVSLKPAGQSSAKADPIFHDQPQLRTALTKPLINTVVDIFQSTARSYAAAGARILEGKGAQVTPTGPLDRALFGTDKPFSLAEEQPFVSPDSKYAAPLAAAFIAPDAFPGFKAGKTALGKGIKSLLHSDDIEFVTKLVTNYRKKQIPSNKDWQVFQGMFKAYGVELPATKKAAIDYVYTALKSADTAAETAEMARMTNAITGTPGQPRYQAPIHLAPKPKPQQPSFLQVLRDEVTGHFQGMKRVYQQSPLSDQRGFAKVPFAGSGEEAGEGLSKSIRQAGPYPTETPSQLPARPQKILSTTGAADIPSASNSSIKNTTIRERGFVTSAKEVIPDAEKIAGQYVPRSTDRLSLKAANLIKDDIKTAERLALTGDDQNSVAVASELLKHYAKLAEGAKDIAAKDAIYDKAAEVANVVAKRLTEQGRAVQAASILGRLTPEGQVRFAAKEILKWNADNPTKKVAEMTGEQAENILTKMREIQKMPDGDEKAMAFNELQEEIHALIPSSWWQKAIAVWKAGLLTGIKTTGLNVFSSFAHSGTEIIKDAPAVAADTLLSILTGKRSLAFTMRGAPSGVQEGVKKGWRYLKTGFDSRDVASKLDYRPVRFKSKVIQTYVDTVFRTLGAQDQIFYYGALRRSFHNQAIAQAKNAGLKGIERQNFIRRLIDDPSDEMSAYALADAETAVFQNKTVLGGVARKIQNIPGGEFVIPFGKTPSAVAMQVVNYSPAGVFIEIGKQIARGKFDQRLLSQAVGRTAVGTGVLWAGSKLYDKGIISLDYPTSERERELWKAEGRKPNSIKIGDSWRTVQTLGPAGPVLLLGAHFKQALESTGSHTEAMLTAFFGTIKSFTEQTFLKGVNDTLGAISDPERNAKNVAASFVSSSIPTIVNDIARALDPQERRTSAQGFVQTVMNRLQSRIPKLREGLEPQVSALGGEQDRIGNPLEVMIDPTRPSPDTSTPVTQELRRLMDAGFSVSPTLLGDKNGYEALSPEQNTDLWKKAGELTNSKLTNLFQAPKYQTLDDEQKADIVEDFVAQSKINARAATVLALIQNLPPQEVKPKLSELKKSGLLTNEVFNKFIELGGDAYLK